MRLFWHEAALYRARYGDSVSLENAVKNIQQWKSYGHFMLVNLLQGQCCSFGLMVQTVLFHGRTRQSYLYNGCLPWYNVVLTPPYTRHEYPWAHKPPTLANAGGPSADGQNPQNRPRLFWTTEQKPCRLAVDWKFVSQTSLAKIPTWTYKNIGVFL